MLYLDDLYIAGLHFTVVTILEKKHVKGFEVEDYEVAEFFVDVEITWNQNVKPLELSQSNSVEYFVQNFAITYRKGVSTPIQELIENAALHD